MNQVRNLLDKILSEDFPHQEDPYLGKIPREIVKQGPATTDTHIKNSQVRPIMAEIEKLDLTPGDAWMILSSFNTTHPDLDSQIKKFLTELEQSYE